MLGTRTASAPPASFPAFESPRSRSSSCGITFAVGKWLADPVCYNIANTQSRETLTLAILAIALSIAVGSAYMFDVSMALGAFLAGMVVGQSEFSLRAAIDALPLRDAFAVLFFVSVGMLFDYKQPDPGAGPRARLPLRSSLWENRSWPSAIVVFLKYPIKTAISVALVLSQIGEFSFILAAMGAELGILPVQAQNILVAAAIISITLNPLLFKSGGGNRTLARTPHARITGYLRTGSRPAPETRRNRPCPGHRHAVVVGYGPVGRTVTKLLRDNGIVCNGCRAERADRPDPARPRP